MSPELTALLLATLPLDLLAAVTLGVWATARMARRLERGAAMDPFQERRFLGLARPPWWARAWGVAVEGSCQTAAFALQAAHHVRRFRPAPVRPEGGPPVVLVAGYLENAGQMWPLARRLAAQGFQPVLVDLPSTLRSIEDNAAFLAERIDEVCRASGRERIGFVGHSMGGVVARALVRQQAEPRLASVVTLGSPHRGTRMARFGVGQSARDMRPGSALVDRNPPARPAGPPVHTLISTQDNIVSPPWSTVLAEGEDVVLSRPVGHVAPLFLPEVAERVVGWLAADLGVPAATPRLSPESA